MFRNSEWREHSCFNIFLVHYIFAYIFLVHDVYTESLELRQSEWREHSCFAYIISA